VPLWPDWGSEALDPPGVDEDEGEEEDEPPPLEGDDVLEGIPPEEPGEDGLLLGEELGTGMPPGVGTDMVACDRQPDTNSAVQAASANRGWPGPVMMIRLRKLWVPGASTPLAGAHTTSGSTPARAGRFRRQAVSWS
jgi:hypothetical protein